MRLLRGTYSDFLQCCYFWLLGIWQSIWGTHPCQFLGRWQNFGPKMVHFHDQCFHYSSTISCWCGEENRSFSLTLPIFSFSCHLQYLLWLLGLSATHKWSAWENIWRRIKPWVLYQECDSKSSHSLVIGHHSNHYSSNASIFWRHQRSHRSIWFHAPWLHLANGVLQLNI